MSETKLCVQAKQNKSFICYLLSAGRCLATFWKACEMVAWADKLHKQELLTPALLFLRKCWVQHHRCVSLSSAGVNSPSCVLCLPVAISQLKGNNEKQVSHQTHWCVINAILVTNNKHSTIQAILKKIIFLPASTCRISTTYAI